MRAWRSVVASAAAQNAVAVGRKMALNASSRCRFSVGEIGPWPGSDVQEAALGRLSRSVVLLARMRRISGSRRSQSTRSTSIGWAHVADMSQVHGTDEATPG